MTRKYKIFFEQEWFVN